MNRAQRIYVYVVLAVTAVLTTVGVSQLAGTLIDEAWPGKVIQGGPGSNVALGIALLAVAGPVWLFHWRLADRKAAGSASELNHWLRQAYLALLSAISLGVAAFAVAGVLTALLGGRPESIDGGQVSRTAFWGAVWAFHWRVARQTWQPGHAGRSLHRWYLYVASAAALAVFVIALARLFGDLLSAAYDSVYPSGVLHSSGVWTDGAQKALATAIVTAVTWAWHWRVGARADKGSTLRDVVVTAVAAGAGVIGMVAAGLVLHTLFRTSLGTVGETTASRLAGLTGPVGLWLAAAPVWLYYILLLLRPARALEPSYASSSATWAYRYFAMGAGLGALAATAVTGIALLAGVIVPSGDVVFEGPGAAREAVATVLATLVLGAAVWLPLVRSIRRAHDDQDRQNVGRLYLFAITGAGLLSAVGGAASLIYILLNDALNGRFGAATVDSARWAFGAALTGATVAALHARAIPGGVREAVSEAVPARRKRVMLIAPRGAGQFKTTLEQALGRSVEWRVDLTGETDFGAIGVPPDAAVIAANIERLPGRAAVILWTPEGARLASHD